LLPVVTFFLVLLKLSIVRIPEVHLGLPSSIFTGRFKREKDQNDCSIPISQPLREGYHLVWPWWKITLINRETRTRKINEREYQVGGEGGTVKVTGVVQYRPSEVSLYRMVEVDEHAIELGLDAEIDEFLSVEIGRMESFEDAITRTTKEGEGLSKKLFEKLTRSPDRKQTCLGKDLDYSQHSYGVDILKATIDYVKPNEELQQARDSRQKELYEKQFQTTEWTHLMEKVSQLRTILPDLDQKEALKAVQIWQRQYPYEFREMKIDSPDVFSSFLLPLIEKIKKQEE
jgi:regulator of protease activity HflC (stomatin/prohibitin superfamily)